MKTKLLVVLGLIHELHGVTEIGLECVGDDGFPWSLILLGIDGVMASLSAGVDQLRKINNESNHCYVLGCSEFKLFLIWILSICMWLTKDLNKQNIK